MAAEVDQNDSTTRFFRGRWLNLLILVLSVALVFGLLRLADILVAPWIKPPVLSDAMEILFPPNSEHEFATPEFRYVSKTNRFGVRDRDFSQLPEPGVYRIIAIGDSYTYGWGVNVEDRWTTHLEKRLRDLGYNVEVLTFAKPGVGPPFYAELAEKIIPLFRPNLVLVCLLQGNDLASAGGETRFHFSDYVRDLLSPYFPHLVLMSQRWLRPEGEGVINPVSPLQKSTAEDNRRWASIAAKNLYDGWDAEKKAKFEQLEPFVRERFFNGDLNPYLIDLALNNPRFYFVALNMEDDWTRTCIHRMGVHLRKIRTVARLYGSDVVALSIPEGVFVNVAAWRNIQRVGYEAVPEMLVSLGPESTIRRAAEMAGLPNFHATQAFRAQREDASLYFELDGHLTPRGHALYAEAITPLLAEWMAQQGVPRQNLNNP
jgi:hypothetical protein